MNTVRLATKVVANVGKQYAEQHMKDAAVGALKAKLRDDKPIDYMKFVLAPKSYTNLSRTPDDLSHLINKSVRAGKRRNQKRKRITKKKRKKKRKMKRITRKINYIR
jgi:hypothetical protein